MSSLSGPEVAHTAEARLRPRTTTAFTRLRKWAASDGVLGSSGGERPLLGGQQDLPRLRRAVDRRVIPVCPLPANHGARRDPQKPPGARAHG